MKFESEFDIGDTVYHTCVPDNNYEIIGVTFNRSGRVTYKMLDILQDAHIFHECELVKVEK